MKDLILGTGAFFLSLLTIGIPFTTGYLWGIESKDDRGDGVRETFITIGCFICVWIAIVIMATIWQSTL